MPIANPDPIIDGGIADSARAQYLYDISIPDGTLVAPDQNLQKTWRVLNTGTSTWQNYRLKFDGGDRMSGPDYVDIPTTAPGETVDITVNLRGPQTSGRGYWQIVNRDGVHVPGGRLYVDVVVVNSGGGGGNTSEHVTAFSADPGSPSSASTVNFNARINWWPGYRAMRVLVDNQIIGETSTTEQTFTWDASTAPRGDHTVVLEVDDQTGAAWDNPEKSVLTYTLTGTPAPANHAPNRPTPDNPYDWYVYYSGNTAHLCARANGDPDGDAITGYYFDIFDSAQTWNSGWSGSSCVNTSALGPYTYQWRVKVRDSRGGESDWSDPRHFTLVNPSLSITDLSFQPQDAKSETVKIRACTAGQGGVGITMRVSVNDASDGSGNGEWHIIKELGVPCFNDNDAPIWRTLPFGDGPHRVRVEAHGTDAGWNGAAVREETYTLPHRRPAEPALVSPIPTDNDRTVFLKTRTVTFRWQPTERATSYALFVSTDSAPKDNPNIVNQPLGGGVTEHTVTFNQDHPLLYWQVRAINDAGVIESTIRQLGIDQAEPTCTVQANNTTVWENVFQLNWSGGDGLAGVRSYDVQVMDLAQGEWVDWLQEVPVDKTFDLFNGQPGHSYAFRCRALDWAGNLGAYPNGPDVSVTVDVSARPQTPWWDAGYAHKRNIIVQNNMSNRTLPTAYPIRLRFDSGTSPTAAQLYADSKTSTKCNDLRVIANDATQLDRIVRQCTSSVIEIWTRTPAAIGANGVNGTSLQLYYGNSAAGAPPQNRSNVYYPPIDGNTVAMWYTDAGSGSTLADRAGSAQNCSIHSSTVWTAPTKFPAGLRFAGGTDGPTVDCGRSSAFNLQEFTFELYIKRTGTAWGRIAGQLGDNQNRWELSWQDERIKISLWENGGQHFSNRRITDYNWHHVAITVKGSNVRIYIDGQLDYSGTLPGGHINTGTPPFTIGSAENIFRAFAEVANVRYSNKAHTSFPHGSHAAITSEPTTTIGASIEPPQWGTPDLALLSVLTYPGPDGDVLVEATVQNRGDLDTGNGFYTDLQIDTVSSAAVDSEPAYRWIASPIDAGKLITLTALVDNPLIAEGSARTEADRSQSSIQEVSKTIYIETDTAGSIGESEEENNASIPVEVCFASEDGYESDDTPENADFLRPDVTELNAHNFHKPDDVDYHDFYADAGSTYLIQTENLGPRSDTLIELYDPEMTLVATNDDHGDSLASRLEWTADANGLHVIKVRHWNPNTGGCGTQYDLSLSEAMRTQDITFTGGWNLFSSLVEPTQTDVQQIMAPLSDSVLRVFGDGLLYDRDLADMHNTLTDLHGGVGYYLYRSGVADATISVTGDPLAIDTPIPLKAGWNWIGYLPEWSLWTPYALQSLNGLYQRVLNFEEVYDPAHPEFSDLNEMDPGQGYLIYMDQAATLIYPDKIIASAAEETIQSTSRTCNHVQPTPAITLVYGYITLNGDDAPVGAVVEALTPNGDVVGCFEVTTAGQYGLMHIYGLDENTDPAIPGFAEGEAIHLRVNGVEVTVDEPPTWQDDKAPHQVDMAIEVEDNFRLYLPAIHMLSKRSSVKDVDPNDADDGTVEVGTGAKIEDDRDGVYNYLPVVER